MFHMECVFLWAQFFNHCSNAVASRMKFLFYSILFLQGMTGSDMSTDMGSFKCLV